MPATSLDIASQVLYDFIWNEYCSWYIELAKPALKNGDTNAQRGTRRTLIRVLEAILRMAQSFNALYYRRNLAKNGMIQQALKARENMLTFYPSLTIQK
ncbi:MAG: class I tRNA ligase family protein [Marinagarivorans sp.]|nr:class I tRNA ligase family protein [Marinagarivorans sp.]